jgi:hypothetical protein
VPSHARLKLIVSLMRWTLPIALVAGCLLYSGWFLLSCDVVTSRYRTLAAARADNLFKRGWLPDILPPSSHSIRTSNNLDLNTSEGEFSFLSSEYSLFADRLRQYSATMRTPFVGFETEIAEMQADGFHAAFFQNDRSLWLFFCEPERTRCEYTMWSQEG